MLSELLKELKEVSREILDVHHRNDLNEYERKLYDYLYYVKNLEENAEGDEKLIIVNISILLNNVLGKNKKTSGLWKYFIKGIIERGDFHKSVYEKFSGIINNNGNLYLSTHIVNEAILNSHDKKSLFLEFIDIRDNENLNHLSKAKYPNLSYLKLSNVKINGDHFYKILDPSSIFQDTVFENVTSLDLSNNQIGSNIEKNLAIQAFIKKFKQLKRLVLTNNLIDDDGLNSIFNGQVAENFSVLDKLEYLCLSFNFLTFSDRLDSFKEYIKRINNNHIKLRINLIGNSTANIKNQSGKAIIESARINPCFVRSNLRSPITII